MSRGYRPFPKKVRRKQYQGGASNAGGYEKMPEWAIRKEALTEKQQRKREKSELANRMRENMTPAEARLWTELKDRRQGYVFTAQVLKMGWILDFHCYEAHVAVEVDGEYHNDPIQAAKDHVRDDALERGPYQIRVLRFTNNDVFERLPEVLDRIVTVCLDRATSRPWRRARGHYRIPKTIDFPGSRNTA